MSIPRLPNNAKQADVVRCVRRAGCVIIEDLASAEDVQAIQTELGGYLDRVPYCEGSFTGTRTKRTGRLVAKSRTCRSLLTNSLILSSISELFLGECYRFQVHGTSASRIDPGERAQSLHRDDGVYPFRHPMPPCHINTIWAIDPFTRKNGATRVVPKSHLWDDHRKPLEDECEVAEMGAGSVLLFDAATYHGAGANDTEAGRTGVILGYTLGWLRQEENQYLAVPPKLARTLPRPLQELLGYTTHGYLGGFEGQNPASALQDPVPDVLPAHDLFTPDLEALSVRRR